MYGVCDVLMYGQGSDATRTNRENHGIVFDTIVAQSPSMSDREPSCWRRASGDGTAGKMRFSAIFATQEFFRSEQQVSNASPQQVHAGEHFVSKSDSIILFAQAWSG